MRRTLLAALAVTGSVALVGCGGSSGSSGDSSTDAGNTSTTTSSASSEPYHVLNIQAMSGPSASFAGAETAALKASANVINSQGGIEGRKIVIQSVNDGADPGKAVSLLQRALSSDTPPDYVFAGTSSSETLALCPVLTRAKIISTAITGSEELNNTKSCKYHFAFNTGADSQTTQEAAFLKSKGYHSIGLIAGSDPLGLDVKEALEKKLEADGMTLTAQQYDPTATDMTPQLTKLKGANVDVLMVEAAGAPAGHIIAGLHQIGWTKPVIGTASVSSTPLAALVSPKQLHGIELFTYKINVSQPGGLSGPAKTAFAAFHKVAGPDLKLPADLYTLTYDGLQAVAAGAEAAHSTDGPAIAKAMESGFDTQGRPDDAGWVSFGTLGFSPTNHFVVPSADDFALGTAAKGLDRNGQWASAK